MEELTEDQFHTVWTMAAKQEGYNKKFFQELLQKLKNKKFIVKETGKYMCSEHGSVRYNCEKCGCPKCNP